MSMTLELSESELSDLRELTRVADTQAAVRSALDEYRRYARRLRLKEFSGTVTMEENWPALEKAETDEARPH